MRWVRESSRLERSLPAHPGPLAFRSSASERRPHRFAVNPFDACFPMFRPRAPQLLILGFAVVGSFTLGRFSHRASTSALPPRAAAAALAAVPGGAVASLPVRGNATDPAPEAALAAVLEAVRRAPDRAARLYDFALRLREVDAGDYPALLQALLRNRFADTPELLAMLCSVWAAHDGPAAFAAARVVAATDGEHPALHAAITAWAQREPAAAQAALHATGLTDLATDEMAAFLQGWASRDPAAAEAFLTAAGSAVHSDDEAIPAAVQRGFEAIARTRIETEPMAAMEWYGRLSEPLRQRLRQAVLSQLAAVDPRLASQWLATDASAQVGSSDLLPVLRGLRMDGFEQQFAWAKTAANPVTRESALAAVVGEGAHAQLVGLGEWLAVRADDASLAPAFSAYAMQVVHKSPSAAVTWAMSLDQPELRQNTLNSVVAEWISVNPRAAREWAQRTGLVDWDALVR